MGGFGDDDVPETGVSSNLLGTPGGIPNIDSSSRVVLGSRAVDAIPRVPFPPAGDDITPPFGDSESAGHDGVSGGVDARVLGPDGKKAARGSKRVPFLTP